MEIQGANPKSEYTRRLAARRGALARLQSWHLRIGNLRLVFAGIAGVFAWLAFESELISPWWLLLPVGAFAGLVVVHDRVRQLRHRMVRAAAFQQRGIDRLEGRWAGSGQGGDRFKDMHHPYSEDLDLFGKGSLFELLCAAGTTIGAEVLAGWLKSPASREEILERQAAVDELRPKLDLREDLAVLGADVGSAVDSENLSSWGSAPAFFTSSAERVTAAFLAAAAAGSLLRWIFRGNSTYFSLTVAVEACFALIVRRRVRRIIQAVEQPGRDLALLSRVMLRLEREPFDTSLLQKLRLGLSASVPPSREIARLNRLIVMLDSRRNIMFAPIAAPLLWGTQFAFAIETWRLRHGRELSGWLTAIGEIEALCSLAGHAYEHPGDTFPVVDLEGVRFEAEGLSHPLISEERAVSNDIRLGGDLRVLVVSGSNMSGKSTLLRSVGVNAVLGLAGGTVRARRMRIAPLAVGASIRTLDSLQEGSSRFYAEITRIRQIVDLAGAGKGLLFLLDELLQGTNSHDRSIGAEAIIRGLVARGAIGLMTTHDLALARIAETLAPKAANVHFEDFIENGRIAFDYKLRGGVVKRSNALELMRSVGLDV